MAVIGSVKVLASTKFQKQAALIAAAEENDEIIDTLAAKGLSIDDLVYENSKSLRWRGSRPPRLSSFKSYGEGVPLASFFTGCGGMDLGFEAVGFKHLAAFEFNEVFCNTLRLNRPDWKVFGPPFHAGDVSKYDEVVDVLSPLITKPFEGIFVGGPPCQPFSIAANQRFSKSSTNFKRLGFAHAKNGNLLFDFVNLVIHFMPAAFVIENVRGFREIDKGKQLSVAISSLQTAGYAVDEPKVYDASDYGVPQYRQRMFLVGARVPGKFSMPKKRKQIGSGSVLASPPARKVSNHDTRNHRVGSVARYMRLDYGQRDHLGRVDRLDPSRPSKTVIAGGTNGGGRSHLHPEIPRTLSVRECARLQTFPDSYKFVGPTARQFTQVGNAVPPVLAAALATQTAKAYF